MLRLSLAPRRSKPTRELSRLTAILPAILNSGHFWITAGTPIII
jgi:hypothetical protein